MKMILKRDGRRTKFDEEKIIIAIKKAFEETENETYDEYAEAKAKNIASYIKDVVENSDKMLDVEAIQDLVEKGLMSCKKKNVAKQYILYRDERNRERNRRSEFNKIIGEKLMATNIQNQNANVDEYSFGGRMGEANTELAKQYALDNLVSDKFARMHNNNILYLHDFGNAYAVGMHNCLTIPIDDLLANGFNTRQQSIRPASTIASALQLVAVIMQCQSLVQFGGVSASHLDWTLVPYVRKSFWKHYKDGLNYVELNSILFSKDEDDIYAMLSEDYSEEPIDSDVYKRFKKAYKYAMDITIRETYQAVEGLFHNLNN